MIHFNDHFFTADFDMRGTPQKVPRTPQNFSEKNAGIVAGQEVFDAKKQLLGL